jgi:type IV pilus assembly protein PilF
MSTLWIDRWKRPLGNHWSNNLAYWRAMLLMTAASLFLGACASTGSSGEAGSVNSANTSVVPEAPDESEERRRARIRLELATGYYQQRNYNVALDELRQSLLADPNYASAYGLLGLIYMDLNEKDKALGSFQKGLQLLPNDSELNNNYGWYLCRNGRERESIDFFIKATRNPLYTTPARPLHNAGICALKGGDEVAAEKYFLQSYQADPRNPVALFQLADLYLKRNDLERARTYSKRLLTLYEPNAETLWLSLKVERKLGNRDGEASLGSQLRRKYPQSRETAFLMTGDYAQ